MAATLVSLTVRGETHRTRSSADPALSFMPLRLAQAKRLLADNRAGR
jgi:hypothetical protein